MKEPVSRKYPMTLCQLPLFLQANLKSRGPGSSVGIPTELRAGRSGDRILVWARFSAPVHTAPGAQPASRTMGTGSFQGVNSGRGVTPTPHPLLVPWSQKGKAIPSLTLWAVRPVESSWNVMAHGDARAGKWKGNWRMEWVASTQWGNHTTSEHGVSNFTTADAHTSAACSRLNWSPPPI
jgi:hypothetical protein